MKKLMFVSLILALVLAVSGGVAESIFPTLPEETTETAYPVAPSYGAMANVSPERVEQNVEGGTIVVYTDVTAADFNRFGAYLGERQFAVSCTEPQDDQIAYAITDGNVEFFLFYDQLGQTMTLVYPQGVTYEQPVFPGYQICHIGDTLQIQGLGDFMFDSFVTNGKAYCAGIGHSDYSWYYDAQGNDMKRRIVHEWLAFEYTNTTTEDKMFTGDVNELFDLTMIFIRDGETYTIEPYSQGAACGTDTIFTAYNEKLSDTCKYQAYPLHPLDTAWRAVILDLPSGITNTSDGTLAAAIDFRTGERYLLMLRENGVNLFDPE